MYKIFISHTTGAFVAADKPEVATFVRDHVSQQGLLGVDVARDDEGALHIIETNRAPMWAAFEAATGVKVGVEVVQRVAAGVNFQMAARG